MDDRAGVAGFGVAALGVAAFGVAAFGGPAPTSRMGELVVVSSNWSSCESSPYGSSTTGRPTTLGDPGELGMVVVDVPAAAWRGGGAARPVRSEWQLADRVRAARSRDERMRHCQPLPNRRGRQRTSPAPWSGWIATDLVVARALGTGARAAGFSSKPDQTLQKFLSTACITPSKAARHRRVDAVHFARTRSCRQPHTFSKQKKGSPNKKTCSAAPPG